MPTLTKKYHGDQGKLVIINLQPTKQDKKADLVKIFLKNCFFLSLSLMVR
jgi:hypothetical protein